MTVGRLQHRQHAEPTLVHHYWLPTIRTSYLFDVVSTQRRNISSVPLKARFSPDPCVRKVLRSLEGPWDLFQPAGQPYWLRDLRFVYFYYHFGCTYAKMELSYTRLPFFLRKCWPSISLYVGYMTSFNHCLSST